MTRVDRGRCLVMGEHGLVRASLGAGVLESMARDATHGPCTGDWCVLRYWPDGPVTVDEVLPRRTAVVRADVAGRSHGQVLAANLDIVAVVVGLLPEPVIGKVERLLALAWESGATPLIVLTKADLAPDAEDIREDVAAAAPGVEVLVCSTATRRGVAELRTLIGNSKTLGLLGPSGAGKSTLVNALVGSDVLLARPIRADGRGRHTSVRRELVVLPGGGAVVDTPGMRGVGLVGATAGMAATFADVEALVASCRFNDCAHDGEPGCAVVAAVEDGRLPVRRLESWHRLQREIAWMTVRADARLRAEQARRWKDRRDLRREARQ